MPIYEYFCERCKHTFEEQRKVGDRHQPAVCPVCNEPIAILAISRTSFILKGTGWWGGHDPGSSEYP